MPLPVPPASDAFTRVRTQLRQARALTQQLRMAAFPYQLGQLEAAILCILSVSSKPRSLKPIAHALGIRLASLSEAIALLETKALVCVHPSTVDRRVKPIALTRTGQHRAARFITSQEHSPDRPRSYRVQQLLVARQRLEQLRRAATPFGMGALQAHLLIELASAHPHNTHLRQTLAPHLHVEAPALTQAIHLLQDKGLIQTTRASHSRIHQTLTLTTPGTVVAHQLLRTLPITRRQASRRILLDPKD